MYDMKQLGAFVAKERKRQGVTQLQLSQATDVGRRFIVELEGGKSGGNTRCRNHGNNTKGGFGGRASRHSL